MLNEETVVVDAQQTPGSDEPTEAMTLEEALAEITKLKDIKNEVVRERDSYKQKSKELEKIAEQFKTVNVEDQVKLKETLEQTTQQVLELTQKYRQTNATIALERELTKSNINPNALQTALDLIKIDQLKFAENEVDLGSVAQTIDQLRQQHPILFSDVAQAPIPKRPEDKPSTSTYETELQALLKRGVTQKELTALKKKYGR